MSSKWHASPWKSLSRPQPSRILGWSRGWKWVQIAMRALETSHFWLVRRNKMSSQCQATTWIIDYSTSPKSNFGLVKRQKMTFKCHSTTWIVGLSTWKKSHFRLVKKQKMTVCKALRTHFLPLDQPKMQSALSWKTDYSSDRMELWSNFCYLTIRKCDFYSSR